MGMVLNICSEILNGPTVDEMYRNKEINENYMWLNWRLICNFRMRICD